MNWHLKTGKYVVGVSGGVDSVVLLDLLANQPGYDLIVAHFDHGMRPNSTEDKQFVEELAKQYHLKFVSTEGNLGAKASEAAARAARYEFLDRVCEQFGATAVVTAHHQDDVLETAIINLLRGSGRKGLTAMQDRPNRRRPLLGVTKAELLEYARKRKLTWREDSTNQDDAYLRNYIRHHILPRFDASAREQLLTLIRNQQQVNKNLDEDLREVLSAQTANGEIVRAWFSSLPHGVAREVMAGWLRANNIRTFDRTTLERLTVAGKVTSPGKQIDILKGVQLRVGKETLALMRPER